MPIFPVPSTTNYGWHCYVLSSVWEDFGCSQGMLFFYSSLGYPASVAPQFQYQLNKTIDEIAENSPDNGMFVYSWPESPEDTRAGRQCTLTGWWAAGRDIVYVDGAPMIREFAIKPESARLATNRTPEDWHI